jgi:hypothetical protein
LFHLLLQRKLFVAESGTGACVILVFRLATSYFWQIAFTPVMGVGRRNNLTDGWS